MPTRDESWPNGTPCWIDVMVTDPAAAKAFYSGSVRLGHPGWSARGRWPPHVHVEWPTGCRHQPQA